MNSLEHSRLQRRAVGATYVHEHSQSSSSTHHFCPATLFICHSIASFHMSNYTKENGVSPSSNDFSLTARDMENIPATGTAITG